MLEILGRHFDLSHNELSEIFEAAKKADHESVDLYRFTAALKKVMDRDQRIAVIERLWELYLPMETCTSLKIMWYGGLPSCWKLKRLTVLP